MSAAPPGHRAAARPTARRSRRRDLRFLHQHAVALALAALLALVALPLALVPPVGDLELIAAAALTLPACVLIASICRGRPRR